MGGVTSLAQAERQALADLLASLGPDAPTLCEGWSTRDLTAHLVLRETRPDAAPGILLPPLSRWTARVQATLARRPFADLVGTLQTGPPRWSPVRLPGLDRVVNTVEYLVHHEDVRRAQPGWEARALTDVAQDEVWSRLRAMSRVLYRRVPVGVALRRPDGREHSARTGEPGVVVAGEPVELLLHAFGRGAAARVHVSGEAGAVTAMERASLGV